MRHQRFYLLLVIAIFAFPAIGLTQPPPPAPPVDVPFDGISTILLATAAGYAIKKGRVARKAKKEN